MNKDKRFINSLVKGVVDEAAKVISGIVGSTGAIDRQGESLNPIGWQTDNYLKNPVVLYGHDYKVNRPVGKTLRVYIEENQLRFDVQFNDTSLGQEIFNLMKDGYLNAVSVGFIPLEFGNDGEYTYQKMELLELSVVPVPANPEALTYLKAHAPTVYKVHEAEEEEEKPTEDNPEEKPAEAEPTQDNPEEKPSEAEDPQSVPEDPAENPEADPEPEPVTKSGRVLSSKNESKITQAVSLLQDVLSSLGDSEDEGKSQGDPITKKFLFQLRDNLRRSDKETGLLLRDINTYLANQRKNRLEKGGDKTPQ